MPSITSRICGICPVSHLLASVEGVRRDHGRPRSRTRRRSCASCCTARRSSSRTRSRSSTSRRPTCCSGMDYDPATPQHRGPARGAPRRAPRRHRPAQVRPAGRSSGSRKERVHPSWTVPGGVNAPLDPQAREKIARGAARRDGDRAAHARAVEDRGRRLPGRDRGVLELPDDVLGLVGPDGSLRLYDGNLRFVDADGAIVADQVRPEDYATYIGEASLPDSYLKAPYYRPAGYPDGIYRVGPARAPQRRRPVRDAGCRRRARGVPPAVRARSSRAASTTTTRASSRRPYALERMQQLLEDPAILDTKVRAHAGVNCAEGVGHHRGAARHPHPPLPGRRQRRHHVGQPHRRHRPQQPRHRPRRPAGREAVHGREQDPGGGRSTGSRRSSGRTTRA